MNPDLTPAEERVYEKVTAGKTNYEIGEELFLNVKTVEYHLTNIYAKLGVENRRQLVKQTPVIQMRTMQAYIEGLEKRVEALERMMEERL